MIRTILIALFILLFFIFSLVFLGITWLIGKAAPAAARKAEYAVVRVVCRIILFLAGTRFQVIGRENIPSDEPVLYIINHRSYFDILLTYVIAAPPTGFIAKKEIARVPVLSLWLTRLNGLFLDRSNIREGLKTILAAIEKVKSGISIAIFPEGTRGKDPDETVFLPFHEGSFKIAVKSGCRIVPVTISGSSDIFEDHMPFVKGRHVIVEIAPPVDPASLTGDDRKFIGKYIQSCMQETMNRNHAKL